MPRIIRLTVYPIKSCAGVFVEQAHVGYTGLKYDREFMVIDREGNFVSQRTERDLCHVKVLLKDSLLTICAEGIGTHQLDLEQKGWRQNKLRQVRIHKESCVASHVDEAYDDFFSELLGKPCEVVRMHPSYPRKRISSALQREILASFSDGYPILVLSEASMDCLNGKVPDGTQIPLNRFRSNIVVRGCSPHAEDRWEFARCGAVELQFAKPCMRCSIPQVDQHTGRLGKEPARSLAKYRRGLVPSSNAVCFGSNYVVTRTGILKVGDELRVH